MLGPFRLLTLALCLVSASGLQLVAGANRAAAVTAARAASVSMALPKVEDARSLSTEEIEKEVAAAKKELFEMRKKVKTRQQVKPHLFTHTKHRIGQLETLLSQRAA